MNKVEIPFKLPSLNQYINECRKNRYAGATMKKNVEKDINWYINLLPQYENPIRIHFHWIDSIIHLVFRYFCLLLLGLSGIVRSMRFASSAGLR